MMVKEREDEEARGRRNIRESAVAGMFYPDRRDELLQMISALSARAEGEPEKDVMGIIVPHAGYVFSGKTACHAFRRLDRYRYKRVIVLGPNHTVYTDRIVIDTNDIWRTALGDVSIDHEHVPEDVIRDEMPHKKEHSIEVEIPFLQHFLEGFSLVPLIVGDITEDNVKKYAKMIDGMMDEKTLLVISTDLSHFLDKEEAKAVDDTTISNITAKQGDLEACGRNPLKIAMELCRMRDREIRLLDYSTSADISGDSSRVVGYASFIF